VSLSLPFLPAVLLIFLFRILATTFSFTVLLGLESAREYSTLHAKSRTLNRRQWNCTRNSTWEVSFLDIFPVSFFNSVLTPTPSRLLVLDLQLWYVYCPLVLVTALPSVVDLSELTKYCSIFGNYVSSFPGVHNLCRTRGCGVGDIAMQLVDGKHWSKQNFAPCEHGKYPDRSGFPPNVHGPFTWHARYAHFSFCLRYQPDTGLMHRYRIVG
jgi:hypothetical protein